MGNCASSGASDQVQAVCAGDQHAPWPGASGSPGASRDCSAPARDARGAPRPQQGSTAAEHLESMVNRVYTLQQELALVSTHPLLALPEAAEAICDHLRLDVLGIWAYPRDARGTAVLLAAAGPAARSLERHAVAHGPQWSAVQLQAAAAAAGPGGLSNEETISTLALSADTYMGADAPRIWVPDALAWAGPLPLDLRELAARDSGPGLRSLAAICIGPPGGEPLGALVLGAAAPGGVDALGAAAAAAALLQHLRHSMVAHGARMARAVHEAPEPVSAIAALLQSGARFMWRACNVEMGVRLALVEPGAANALIFESARASPCRRERAASASANVVQPALRGCDAAAAAPPLHALADVSVRELPMQNTLLSSAVSLMKARFVRDVAAYMQNCPSPARDVLTHASQVVSSVVVVPLLAGGAPFGALYFTQAVPCDFGNIQDSLLGFVHSVAPAVHNKLAGSMATLRDLAADAVNTCKSFDLCELRREAHLVRQSSSDSAGESSGVPSTSQTGIAPGTGGAGGGHCLPARSASLSGRLSRVASRQLCTEAMLQVLQQEIQRGRRRSVELQAVDDQLAVGEPIGHGGYGRVYRGSWHKRPAAIKVLNSRDNDSEAVSDAMEMAVLSSMQHPSIVQVYSCLTDMVEVPGSAGSAQSNTSGPSFRRMRPGDYDQPTYNVIVMEFCDRGTLGDAVKRDGLFHRRLPNGVLGVDLAAVIDILLDVATSLQYMHGLNLVHGDVKLENVLLKTDTQRPLGVAPKLADFGLTKILGGADHAMNLNGAGTVTHLAPEMFVPGSRITTAVDVYAFGVLMYEAYTATNAYAGLTRAAVAEAVSRRRARPTFPRGAPREVSDLAASCWAEAPEARPGFATVVTSLQAVADSLAADAARAHAQQAAAAAEAAWSASLGAAASHAQGKWPAPTAAPAQLAAPVLLAALPSTAPVLLSPPLPPLPPRPPQLQPPKAALQPGVLQAPQPAEPLARPLLTPSSPGVGVAV